MNTKVMEVKSSILFKSASEADKERLMGIAKIGDDIAKLAESGDLTPSIMKDHIEIHLSELDSIESRELRELLSKATWAEAQVEAERITGMFGDDTFNLFMSRLRKIGQF